MRSVAGAARGTTALSGRAMLRGGLAFLLLGFGLAAASHAATNSTPTVIVVTGAAGEESFGQEFARSAARWEEVARRGGASFHRLGTGDGAVGGADLDRLRALLDAEEKETAAELWLVLIGHGTFDGKEARFNLRGPDLSPTDLASWLKPFRRPVAVLNTASASAPFLPALSAPNRVVITATRSGSEQNYARFGGYLAGAIGDPAADLDHDGQTSLLEAFLLGSRRLSDFYESEGRLATEHPLIDDNADGQGTPPDWFRGVRVVKKASGGGIPDGRRAHQWALVRGALEAHLSAEQRARRDELELKLARLRDRKEQLPEAEYYAALEKLVRELAVLYQPGASEAPAAAPVPEPTPKAPGS